MSSTRQPDSEPTRDALSRVRRMVLTLAMLPVLPTLAGLAAFHLLPQLGFEEFFLFHLLESLLFVVAMLLTWRPSFLWTTPRILGTAFAFLAPFTQVVYDAPLWNAGWIDSDLLRIGQEQLAIAMWIWLFTWIWWDEDRPSKTISDCDTVERSLSMNGITRSAVASIGFIPACFGVFVIAALFADDVLDWRSSNAPMFGYTVAAVFCVYGWYLCWRRHVRWSRRVIHRTVVVTLVCFCVPIAASLPSLNAPRFLEKTMMVLPVIGWGVWLALTMWIWPLKDLEPIADADGPKCLKCGYSLRGLSATRCPECGDEPTLDALWEGQA